MAAKLTAREAKTGRPVYALLPLYPTKTRLRSPFQVRYVDAADTQLE